MDTPADMPPSEFAVGDRVRIVGGEQTPRLAGLRGVIVECDYDAVLKMWWYHMHTTNGKTDWLAAPYLARYDARLVLDHGPMA